MLKIEYLICASRSWGTPTVNVRGVGARRMNIDARLGCAVLVCATYAEFKIMNEQLVGKSRGRASYWAAVQVRNTETNQTFDPPDMLVGRIEPVSLSPVGAVVSERSLGHADAAVVGRFEAAPAGDSNAGAPDTPAPEGGDGPPPSLPSLPPAPAAGASAPLPPPPPPPPPVAKKSAAKKTAAKKRARNKK